MTGLLLLGFVACGGTPRPTDPPHLRLPGTDRHDALALALDQLPNDTANEMWAIEAALAQNAVLSAYVATEDVLPVVLGAAFSGAGPLRDHLKDQGAAIAARMQPLIGRAEFILHLLPLASAPAPFAPATGGAAFLRQRSAARDLRRNLGCERHDFAERASSDLRSLAVAAVARSPKSGGPILDVSLLVERTRTTALIERARAVAEAATGFGLALRMIGPCAPHSFTGREERCDA